MKNDVFTYIIGGKAGHGTKKAGIVTANFFMDLKHGVFQMNDYLSLIRGGHNFSVVIFLAIGLFVVAITGISSVSKN